MTQLNTNRHERTVLSSVCIQKENIYKKVLNKSSANKIKFYLCYFC